MFQPEGNQGGGRGRGPGRGGRGPGRGGHNRGGRGQRGHPYKRNVNGDQVQQQGENGNGNGNPVEPRRGPVFGFKRLSGYLDNPSDEVIFSITRDSKEWEEFLQSDAVKPSNDRNNLHLTMQVITEKVIGETLLHNQQMEICVPTLNEVFRQCLTDQCSRIMMDNSNGAGGYLPAGFRAIDKSPTTFLKGLLKYSKFILRRMPEMSFDFLTNVLTSALGACALKSAYDSVTYLPLQDDFKKLIEEVKNMQAKLEEQMKKTDNRHFRRNEFTQEEEQELHRIEAPDNFREISLVPSVQELLSREEVFLRPNLMSGKYQDSNHYLDVQFRLLREDFVRPLKQGIQDFMLHRIEYLSKKKKIPLGTVRVYPDVQIVSAAFIRDTTVYKVQLPEEAFKRIKWDKSKRLLTGSLLVFTADLFKSAYFAVVATRKVEELQKGVVTITWEGEGPVWDKDDEYLMIEAEVYFEAYRYSLQTLKDLELEKFPMYKFIVEASSDVGPPNYLLTAKDAILMELRDGREVQFHPMELGQWPTAEALGLDDNQFKAFQVAITKEFCIIQGPPGTGKTFIGLKIAETFLQNPSLWNHSGSADNGPILVVCYTNHALDQFLEGILEVQLKLLGRTKDENVDPGIVRVGGRSQSEALGHYSLREVARRKSRTMPKHFWPNKNEIMYEVETYKNLRAECMEAVLALRDLQGVINFEKLSIWSQLQPEYPKILWDNFQTPSWLWFNDTIFSTENFNEEYQLRRMFTIREIGRGKVKKVFVEPPKEKDANNGHNSDSEVEEDYDIDELEQDRILDDVYNEVESKDAVNTGKFLSYIASLSLKHFDKQLSNLGTNIGRAQKDLKLQNREELVSKMKKEEKMLTNKRKFLDLLFSLYKADRIDLPDVTVILQNVKESPTPEAILRPGNNPLPLGTRWALYFAVVERARALSAEQAAIHAKQLIHWQKKLQEMQRFADGWILKNSRVVGMTTTGAAKYNDLVKMMGSKIVIVEEAAEVLESHIVTCITDKCEHLILIGDHRQLRPSTTVYDLAKKYHLDISLFERMINNNLNCYQLKVQHRMRPQIADLVVGTIYTELHNAPNVYRYPKVLGVKKNLFFISHNELEKSETDSMSKSNSYEAKFLAAFSRYLILQGYEPKQITVLTTYTGQMFLLKKSIGAIPNCRGIRVTCVDNFQGEENDIILLSLVRSNMDSKIGFLSVDNRICVALSRAKHGMFIIGNGNMLAKKSRIWSQIIEKLEPEQGVGSFLFLECQVHGTESRVQNGEDFNLCAPEGGCRLLCDALLKCTHTCKMVCHNRDRKHEKYDCREPCLKSCANGHLCQQQCFRKCPPCLIQVTKHLPCGHDGTMPCFKSLDLSTFSCLIQVEKVLPCGHSAEMACFFPPTEFTCKQIVTKKLRCQVHEKDLECHVDPNDIRCKVIIEKTLDPCGHKQDAECWLSPEVIRCLNKVKIVIPDCKHEVEVLCCDKGKKKNCNKPCVARLPKCGHACTKICHLDEDPHHLEYKCKKDCAKRCINGHNCTVNHKCFTPCPPCNTETTRKLKCGHVKDLPCSLDYTHDYECLEPCERKLPCSHKCQNLCFQPCGPCEFFVSKRISNCGHAISVMCHVEPTQWMCNELVIPSVPSPCGHRVLVPCRMRTTTSEEEIAGFCTVPCRTVFLEDEGMCGHTCAGTCGKCKQGRLHEKCGEECGRTLVCGHVCASPCSKSCPPCQEKCFMRCEHSACEQQCSVPCADCAEPCPWNCPHKKCDKLCREQCVRDGCDLPCPKTLACGHPCIGFCGEPCPTHCRICDREHLMEFFVYGNEGDDDARFIYLADCNHSIESTAMEYFMNMDAEEIGMKRCPRCHTLIRHCRRYNTIIRKRLQDVLDVKKKLFGNPETIRGLRDAMAEKLKWDKDMKWGRSFGILQAFLTNKVMGKDEIDEGALKSLNFLMTCGEKGIEILTAAKETGVTDDLTKDLAQRYRNLFRTLMARTLPLSEMEVRNVTFEMERLHDLYQIYRRRSHQKFTNGHSRALPIYEELLKIVNRQGQYNPTNRDELHELLQNLEDVLQTGLGISDMERMEILAGLNLAQGRWFKCPNGHCYVITECGGAMEEAKCNECGAIIGGGNHALRRDNAIATEVDGAVNPLYPTMLMR